MLASLSVLLLLLPTFVVVATRSNNLRQHEPQKYHRLLMDSISFQNNDNPLFLDDNNAGVEEIMLDDWKNNPFKYDDMYVEEIDSNNFLSSSKKNKVEVRDYDGHPNEEEEGFDLFTLDYDDDNLLQSYEENQNNLEVRDYNGNPNEDEDEIEFLTPDEGEEEDDDILFQSYEGNLINVEVRDYDGNPNEEEDEVDFFTLDEEEDDDEDDGNLFQSYVGNQINVQVRDYDRNPNEEEDEIGFFTLDEDEEDDEDEDDDNLFQSYEGNQVNVQVRDYDGNPNEEEDEIDFFMLDEDKEEDDDDETLSQFYDEDQNNNIDSMNQEEDYYDYVQIPTYREERHFIEAKSFTTEDDGVEEFFLDEMTSTYYDDDDPIQDANIDYSSLLAAVEENSDEDLQENNESVEIRAYEGTTNEEDNKFEKLSGEKKVTNNNDNDNNVVAGDVFLISNQKPEETTTELSTGSKQSKEDTNTAAEESLVVHHQHWTLSQDMTKVMDLSLAEDKAILNETNTVGWIILGSILLLFVFAAFILFILMVVHNQRQRRRTRLSETIDFLPTGFVLSSMTLPSNSILLLNFVAIIWGSQHAVIKTCVSDLDPSSISLVRFFLGALIATVGVFPLNNNKDTDANPNATTKKETINRTTLRWGAEMGLWMFLGYAFQAIGLEYTTAQKSGFLLYLNVKFVPFFAFALLGRSISLPTWVSAFSALIGTALLAYDGNSLNLNIGDAWSIAAAAASAMYILRLERASAAVPNSAALNVACLWFVTGASIIWSAQLDLLHVDSVIGALTAHPWELFYLSAITTSLANWIQTKAQKNVTAERASVIYAMDPVWGAIWAYALLGETLSSYGVLGAGVITIAAVTNAFLDFGKGVGK